MKYVALVALTLCSCKQTVVEVPGPLGLPPLRVERIATADEIALGKKLFFDTKLSLDKTISCASCHNPETGFADARKVSVGVGGKTGKRNAPTVLNAAYWRVQFWDGRAGSLEEQAAGPMGNELEMNHKPELLMARLAADPEYGPMKLTLEKVLFAIASYERTLLSGNSAFDRYTYGGDRGALSSEAVEGFKIFGQHCVTCHTIGPKDALFTDEQFHNIGVGVNSEGVLVDQGRGKGEFRTPSLRNVARTAPYMHDGSLKTLKQVVDFYVGGGNSNDHLDPQIRPLELSGRERDALVAFLESLNGVEAK
jgi:cytochrome c peroxidase